MTLFYLFIYLFFTLKTEFSIPFMISLKCVYKASNRKVPKLWGEKGLTERPKAMQLLAGRLEKCSPFHSSGLFTRLSGSHFRLKLSYHRRRSGLKFLKPSQCREFSRQIVPSSIFSWGPYPLTPPNTEPPSFHKLASNPLFVSLYISHWAQHCLSLSCFSVFEWLSCD